MPKTIIDYSKCIMYKIVCNDLEITDIYVGSTTAFTKRKCGHKTSCNNKTNKSHKTTTLHNANNQHKTSKAHNNSNPHKLNRA